MASSGVGSIAPQTVVDIFRSTVERVPDSPVYYTKAIGSSDYTFKTWAQYYADCRKFAKSLIALGLAPFHVINIIGFNSIEWVTACIGAILGGCIPAGVYTTSNPEACHFIAEHSEAHVVLCDGVAQLEKYVAIAHKLPVLKALVVYNDVVPSDLNCPVPVLTFADFLSVGREVTDAVLEARMSAQKPGNCCTLIYTSGTTGHPKAVMLSHDNLTWTVEATVQQYEQSGLVLNEHSNTVSYLPLSHVAAQLFDIYLPITRGLAIYFAQPDALKGSLGTTLKEARPTLFFAVPRLDEDNFCSITGRIKELIITAGGENIPPVLLEDAIKEEIPLLSNAMAIGDRRKFLTAVFTLKVVVDADGNPSDQLDSTALAILTGLGSTATTVGEAKTCHKVKAYVETKLKKANGRAASRAQHIQKYIILDKDFSIGGDELTATLKLKRRVVMAKYEHAIEAMYA
ncbi:hypothetical protein H257_09878 [Aphanomyces astaci]|uniref:AMP-dependent synthetase/ligase domain-containing protein n=1 Tax=Aphanomyces astaci TaxID=112090 RepID=W4G884_APHAT|nr:hypothetical protein H257_09878 [Aphanomyces astaci]ETV75917.1 hypothetical protein H257_09878 [Aphanomyces astaci]|eukprot:XP_009834559.1 hypothetical protein H257_09878 [Aphanomyces astaci]